ncbi:alpha-L-rhamnosidase [Acidipila sp. EB88]|uniref:alpha-L-rhamnosidase n=1 Tax=Acidipila sp. EB88 TaxID=2305226 RepID=UPI000F602ADE|nr:alpha-L-rhamnosidase [Acidipila sp. EB88]RRA48093.1 alpha-L-rhamnosidase [Acidipila sp. EB88]
MSRLFRAFTLFAFAAAPALLAAHGEAQPVHLTVNGLKDPLGIDTAQPALSWQSDATARNWKQAAYEVLVASTPEKLRAGQADVWDSGRRVGARSVDIAYGGPVLRSRERCYWQVRVWDAQGHSAMATEPAVWEMGLLSPADWQAQWIRREDPRQAKAMQQMQWLWLKGGDVEHVAPGTVAEFRTTLHIDRLPQEASLHVLSGGDFAATVNGVRTGHKEAWGSFDQEEIGDRLHVGDNHIVVKVAAPGGDPGTTVRMAMAAAVQVGGSGADADRWLVTGGERWEARTVVPMEKSAQAAAPGPEQKPVMGPWQAVKVVGPLAEQHFGVGTDRSSPAPTPDRIVSSASLLRTDFTTHGAVAQARLYITALGSYRATVNGQPVSDAVLTPGFTDFRKRVLYQTYDVTRLVQSGANVLGAELGAGWHGSPLLWSGTRLFPGADRLRAQLELQYADGTRQVVVSGPDWHAAPAPVLAAEIYGGETYDARRALPGWDTPGGSGANEQDARQWSNAVADPAAAAITVSAQPDLLIRRQLTVTPTGMTQVMAGKGTDAVTDTVFDMGQNMVGAVQLRVQGPRGTTVRLRFAERLNPDGTVYTENLRDADATDTYILSGDGQELWTPRFTFHGFRYVEVSGLPGAPSLETLEGQVWNSLPAKPAMEFSSASDLLNRMDQLGLWGQRGNFVSIPTDCPQRDERMGWMGDAGVFWRTGAYNFDTDAFSNKYMQDVIDAQDPNGAFANISPDLLQGVEHTGAPGWGDAGVLVPYATWLQYGNASLVKRSWPAMERWMDFILASNPDFVRKNKLGPNYADWLAPDPHTPGDLVGTAYWAIVAQQMQQMATAIGRPADAAKYARLYLQIRKAYQAAYVHSDGTVAGDTQTGYVLTVYAGLAPEAMRKGMVNRLAANIAAHDNHLTTGFLGTPFLMTVLDEGGRTDVAYTLLLSTTYPSWGYMVSKGATTWWERWNGDTGDPSMNSYNHYSFGSVMAWVYRRAAGIDVDPKDPAFHHILVSPHPDAHLPQLRATYQSVYGAITTDWSLGAEGFRLRVVVPPNTTATVRLPEEASGALERNGKHVNLQRVDGLRQDTVGSGVWEFAAAAGGRVVQ